MMSGASGELLYLLPEFDVRPAGLEEGDSMPGSFPRDHLMRIASDCNVAGEDDRAASLANCCIHST